MEMESQYIAANGAVEGNITPSTDHQKQVVMMANQNKMKGGDLLLRLLAFALTLVAAIVVGVDKQTKIVSMTLVPTLPPLDVPVTAKWHYLSAFVYFVVANAIACGYAAISLVVVLAKRGANHSVALMITVLDLVMVALLFSGGGAALAVGLIGYKGNSHVQWNKVCNVFGRFCNHVAAAVVISMLGAAIFCSMVLISTWRLHKRALYR